MDDLSFTERIGTAGANALLNQIFRLCHEPEGALGDDELRARYISIRGMVLDRAGDVGRRILAGLD